MTLSIIVASSLNHVIGKGNQLPWHLPIDLKYFKKLTTDHTIIMGRKTYESIGKPLPNRENIVITSSSNFQQDGIITFNSIEKALDYCKNKEEVFIIGGEKVFKQTLHLAHKIYLTKVDTTIENGDTFFPDLSNNIWQLIHKEFHPKDEKNIYNCSFEVYERI